MAPGTRRRGSHHHRRDALACDPDVVDVLVPTPLHADVALPIIEAGFAVQLQKPVARSLDCLRLTAADTYFRSAYSCDERVEVTCALRPPALGRPVDVEG